MLHNSASEFSEEFFPYLNQKHLPTLAIIGRPNVGKSTLVNRLVGARTTIVDDMPGITRDRTYHMAEWLGRPFRVVDTGGLVADEAIDPFGPLVNEQINHAIDEADAVLLVVDGLAGITAVDEQLAHMVRQKSKPVFVTVNKLDRLDLYAQAAEFYQLGLGDPHPVSAMHGGVGDLLDAVFATFPPHVDKAEETDEDLATRPIRVALVGRPNVGKSSILNHILGENRSIVSDISGTTRDSIDAQVHMSGRDFVMVDTAGIRRKSKVDYGVEMFAVDRSVRAIRSADVSIVVIDSIEGVTDQDKRIIQTVLDAGKGLVLNINKWDLFPDKDTNSVSKHQKQLRMDLPHVPYAPVVYTSAETGQRIAKLFDPVKVAFANNYRRISTSVINQVIMDAVRMVEPPSIKNKRLKILYSTQVSVSPPTFVLFVNDPKLLTDAYRRYLEKKLREAIAFEGTPIIILPRQRTQTKPRRTITPKSSG